MNLTLPSTRSWQDAFGTAILTLEGGTGGRVTLIVSPLETSREALDVVLQSRSFKGRLALAVLEDIRGTPVIHAIQTLEAKAVIVLDPHTHVAVAGPVVTLEPPSQGFPTSLEYAEPATLPGWNAGWMTERVQH